MTKDDAIVYCIDKLTKLQKPDGSFRSVSFGNNSEEEKRTTFYTSLILGALSPDEPRLENVIRRGKSFLLQQRSMDWTWNYFSNDESNKSPYPDDLDDTSTALTALTIHKYQFSEESFAKIIKTFIAQEKTPGGPYYTWITKHTKPWDDIDLVVNSNIYNFLLKQSIEIKPLYDFIEKQISRNSYESKYYESPAVVIYFLAKWYRGKHRANIIKKIYSLKHSDGSWGSPLFTACAIVSLIKLGESIDKRWYMHLIRSLPNLKTDPVFIEQISGKDIYRSGSIAFTLSIILEALATENEVPKQIIDRKIKLRDQVVEISAERLSSSELKRQFYDFLTPRIKKDFFHEITLTPYFFWQDSSRKISKSVSDSLCAANTLGWVGYSIFDNVLDGDGDEDKIPLATQAVREVLILFSSASNDPNIKRILNTIDDANYWEQNNCKLKNENGIFVIPKAMPKYGDYSVLAEKSLGHALGPIVLSFLEKKGLQAKRREQFFRHYLIARQLNDDAHDWLKDLRNGYLNPANTLVLKKWIDIHPSANDLPEDMELQNIFWNSVIDSISKLILKHTNEARIYLKQIGLNEHSDIYEKRLNILENSAKTAVSERDATNSFIHAFERA